jgi:hypothetical protein
MSALVEKLDGIHERDLKQVHPAAWSAHVPAAGIDGRGVNVAGQNDRLAGAPAAFWAAYAPMRARQI